MGVLKGCLIFLTGAAAGAGAAWFVMNKKLADERKTREEKIQAAIDQVKESYSNSEKNQEIKAETMIVKESDSVATPKETEEYKDIVGSYNLFDDEYIDIPRVFLTYVAREDAVVYNDSLTLMEDAEEHLGDNFREQFEDDGACFKNDEDGVVYDVDVDEENMLDDIIGAAVDDTIVAYSEGGD